jgi:hypothetical protein
MALRALILSAFLAITACASADTPTTRPALPTTNRAITRIDPGRLAVQAAVIALNKEYASYLKDPRNTKLRAECGYLTDNPSPDITPETIVSALEISTGGNADQQAYVKWQLLSGIPGKVDDKLAPRLLNVYRKAPAPIRNPAVDHARLEQAIAVIAHQPQRADAINADLGKVLDQSTAANESIVHYRDTLQAKLPNSTDALAAGLEDAYQRIRLGVTADGISDQLIAGLSAWAVDNTSPRDHKIMSDAVKKLADFAGDFTNQPYSAVSWDDNEFALIWHATPVISDTNRLYDLSNTLVGK